MSKRCEVCGKTIRGLGRKYCAEHRNTRPEKYYNSSLEAGFQEGLKGRRHRSRRSYSPEELRSMDNVAFYLFIIASFIIFGAIAFFNAIWIGILYLIGCAVSVYLWRKYPKIFPNIAFAIGILLILISMYRGFI